MEKVKDKFSKYGLAEWIMLLFGTVAIGIQLYRYAYNTLEGGALDISVFVVAFLGMFAPKAIVNIIRKQRGIPVK